MHSFKLTHPDAQSLICRLGLQSKKVLGRGSFSAVFAHPDPARDTVIKITNDKASYAYLDEGARCYGLDESRYFPKVIDYLADINEELIDADSDFRVVELERLAKGRVSSTERRLLYAFASRSFNALTPAPVTPEEQEWAAAQERKRPELCEELERFATRLATFCADYHFRLDGLTGGNSMLRGDQLVFNDPVFCEASMNAVRSKYAAARRQFNYFH